LARLGGRGRWGRLERAGSGDRGGKKKGGKEKRRNPSKSGGKKTGKKALKGGHKLMVGGGKE